MIRKYDFGIIGIEKFRTRDGKEFYDYYSALQHTNDLDAKEAAQSIIEPIIKENKDKLNGVDW